MTPLHWIGEGVRGLLQAIPMWCVRCLFVGLLAGLLIWVLRLPRSETTNPEQPESAVDLRWGAAAALAIQIVIYSTL